MNEELIKDIFITIAFKAMDSGKEIRLEKGKNTSKSKVLGGGLSENSTDYDSLSFWFMKAEDMKILPKKMKKKQRRASDGRNCTIYA